MAELVPRAASPCACWRKAANMGLNIDAEEADRLALSLDVIEAVLADPRLPAGTASASWCRPMARARRPCDRLALRAGRDEGRRIMVRLVKGAYWDTEIKRAQVEGLAGFPVFTRKASTDVSYLANARKLLAHDRPDLSAIRHPQRPHRGAVLAYGRGHAGVAGGVRVPAPARHGRGAARR